MTIDDLSRSLLEFEERWGAHTSQKEEAIHRELHLRPARYYQLLSRLIDDPGAIAYKPQLCRRLRDRRDSDPHLTPHR